MEELLSFKIGNLSVEEFSKYVILNPEPIKVQEFAFNICVDSESADLEIRINIENHEQYYSNSYERSIGLVGKVYYNIARYFIREGRPSPIYDNQVQEYSFEFKLHRWSDSLTREEVFVRQFLEGINYEVKFSSQDKNSLPNRSLILRKTCGFQKFFIETFNLLLYLTGDNNKYHNIKQRLIAHELSVINFDRLLDLGCGDGQFIFEKHEIFLNPLKEQDIIGVELDESRYKEAVFKSKLLPPSCKLKLMNGDITRENPDLSNYDAVVLIEVIEHLLDDQLRKLEINLFENIKAKNIFISTPNSDYSLYTEKIYDNGFRHLDHKFEWGKSRFLDWAKNLADTYNYKIYYYPLGIMDDLGATVSQMVYFSKSQENLN